MSSTADLVDSIVGHAVETSAGLLPFKLMPFKAILYVAGINLLGSFPDVRFQRISGQGG